MATAATAAPDVSGGAIAVAPGRSRRRLTGLAILLVLLAVVVVASLALGARAIPPGQVLSALVHGRGGSADDTAVQVVRELRVPRTLLGLAVGAALGLAGALMQAITRNPLADPGLLGVSAGSSLAVVLGIALAGAQSSLVTAWYALAGAAVASLVVYGLGGRAASAAGSARLALAGAAVSAAVLSMVRGIMLLRPAVFDSFRFWIVGSVAGRPLSVLVQLGPFLLAGAVIALALARSLNSLALGDDLARTLGSRPGLTRALGVLAVMLLSGGATAAAGPIVFVGLLVPHAVRFVTGPDQRWILPYSMLGGQILLLTADVLGRLVDPPGEVEVGVCVAVIGAPLFILMVRRRTLVAP